MTKTEALKLALEALEDNQHLIADNERHAYVMEYNDLIEKCKEALAQPEQEPVAWLQFRDNEPPVVAPRDLGTPVFLGIRGGLAHDAQSKEQL